MPTDLVPLFCAAALGGGAIAPLLFATQAAVSPARVLEAFVRTVNEHDVDASLALLADDFEFRDDAGTFVVDRESVPALFGWDVAVRARSTYEALASDASSITVRLRERNDFLAGLGIETLEHDVRYEFEDGRITAIVLLEPDKTARITSEALAPVLEWAREAKPAEREALLWNGSPRYTGESAPRWLELLAAARASGVLR